jgi:hypothetical protein
MGARGQHAAGRVIISQAPGDPQQTTNAATAPYQRGAGADRLVLFRDLAAAALEMCRALEAKIAGKAETVEVLKGELARAEEQLEHFQLIRPMGSVIVAAVLGMLLGALTVFLWL